MKVGLAFGAMVAPIANQLRDQGFMPRENRLLDVWQRSADSITRLSIHGLLTQTEAHRARSRLLSQIANDVSKVTQ